MDQRIIRYMLLSLLLASFIGATATTDRVVVTSGRVVYDAFGRAVKVYHPTVDGDTVTAFSCEVDTVPPTVTAYDVLDRPVRVTYPDYSVTEMDYRVEGHALVTHVTDALSNETETHVSGSGRTLKSIQYDGSEQIVTQFTYDGIDRLVEVLDADTNVGDYNFLHNPPPGTQTKIRANGDVLRYNSSTNTFGVMDSNGNPKTFFRPKEGIDYWNKTK